METKRFQIDPEHMDMEQIRQAAQILREGGLVAFPTETVYGLGGDAEDPDASRAIYASFRQPFDRAHL